VVVDVAKADADHGKAIIPLEENITKRFAHITDETAPNGVHPFRHLKYVSKGSETRNAKVSDIKAEPAVTFQKGNASFKKDDAVEDSAYISPTCFLLNAHMTGLQILVQLET
jgi:hypothetical protein